MDTSNRSTAEADAFLAENPDIISVDMLVPDMSGILRGKQLMRDAAPKLFTEGVRLPVSNYLLDWTGQSVPPIGYGTDDGDPDWYCMAVPGTLKRAPWAKRPTGQALTSMVDENGEPHFADPRHIVQMVQNRFKEIGLTPVVAIEYEFYLIDQQSAAEGVIRPARSPSSGWRSTTTNVYSHDDLADFGDLLADVHVACEAQDIPAETFVSEYAPGQFEINILHSADALQACDNAILLERCIREVSRSHGVIATFMAKPFIEQTGSGLHVHVSLIDDDGNNVLAGPMDAILNRPISDTMRQAIAGLVKTLPEAMAIFAPNANSYRRLMPGAYAPVNTHWGGDNRTLCIRIPPSDEKAVRIEHRASGADANPYLVTAAVLAGMHHGITNALTPPAPIIGDAAAVEGTALPTRWETALDLFAKAEVMPEYLGAEYCKCFHGCRAYEADNFHAHIDPLEYQWYLRTA
jgi:glutamine synthetase